MEKMQKIISSLLLKLTCSLSTWGSDNLSHLEKNHSIPPKIWKMSARVGLPKTLNLQKPKQNAWKSTNIEELWRNKKLKRQSKHLRKKPVRWCKSRHAKQNEKRFSLSAIWIRNLSCCWFWLENSVSLFARIFCQRLSPRQGFRLWKSADLSFL